MTRTEAEVVTGAADITADAAVTATVAAPTAVVLAAILLKILAVKTWGSLVESSGLTSPTI